mmetsp:Transcript_12287/g.16954  ORF Transcript_12287/g.16954 Transcript_12287/m.16954 type:complete len:190 (-) Transcript_12287:244-813(-)|eukprot:CAMPEP_0185734484 /NCGR_PEP_ID=MMETSP1171-20130828/22647_1 /TAXON_ID=374046 /ORGANISM="Helicotheca tamensis, Strain CCMP826" /LENGTH=189 /DNA_ID=CAMNT_0028404487 /DNA_START=82 /DNA_END=651 /DNA_ORIENTATION=+
MGSPQSKSNCGENPSNKHDRFRSGLRKFGEAAKENVEHELSRRMMIQREVQMAVNIAKARDNIQIFGSAWALFVSGITALKIARKPVPPVAAVPVVVGGLMLGNLADMAYGNKLARINREAEHILDNERERLVPMKQAPMAKFYTEEEKEVFFDEATPAAMVWPSSMFSRSFLPSGTVEKEKKDDVEQN